MEKVKHEVCVGRCDRLSDWPISAEPVQQAMAVDRQRLKELSRRRSLCVAVPRPVLTRFLLFTCIDSQPTLEDDDKSW